MLTDSSTENGDFPKIDIGFGLKVLKDYQFNFSLIDFEFKEEFVNIYPRSGYLICNLFLGEPKSCRFINYTGDVLRNNRLYFTGLFSEESLQFAMNYKGRGYAFKLHPVLAYHFLKLPMTEITDRPVMVSDALEIRGRFLRELERSEPLDFAANQALSQFLWNALPDKKLLLSDPIYHAVNRIIVLKGLVSVGNLAIYCSMSKRTLRRQFLLKVGLPPQSYIRILKMENALQFISANPKMSLEEVAFHTGYYDVAHLAHDFKNNLKIRPSTVPEAMNPLLSTYIGISASF